MAYTQTTSRIYYVRCYMNRQWAETHAQMLLGFGAGYRRRCTQYAQVWIELGAAL